jgi:hypothetical protein
MATAALAPAAACCTADSGCLERSRSAVHIRSAVESAGSRVALQSGGSPVFPLFRELITLVSC